MLWIVGGCWLFIMAVQSLNPKADWEPLSILIGVPLLAICMALCVAPVLKLFW